MPKCSLDALRYFISMQMPAPSGFSQQHCRSLLEWQQYNCRSLLEGDNSTHLLISLMHTTQRQCPWNTFPPDGAAWSCPQSVSTPSSLSAESSNFSHLLILGYGDRSCLLSPLVLFCSIPPIPVHHAACCTAWWDKNHLSSSELKNSFFCSAEPVKKMLYLLQ